MIWSISSVAIKFSVKLTTITTTTKANIPSWVQFSHFAINKWKGIIIWVVVQRATDAFLFCPVCTRSSLFIYCVVCVFFLFRLSVLCLLHRNNFRTRLHSDEWLIIVGFIRRCDSDETTTGLIPKCICVRCSSILSQLRLSHPYSKRVSACSYVREL